MPTEYNRCKEQVELRCVGGPLDGKMIIEVNGPMPKGRQLVIPVRDVSGEIHTCKRQEATEICWYVRGDINTLEFLDKVQCVTEEMQARASAEGFFLRDLLNRDDPT